MGINSSHTTRNWAILGIIGAASLWTLKVIPDALDIARSWLLPEQEIKFWEAAEHCNKAECLQTYIDKYPHGQFVAIAKAKMTTLHPSTVTPNAAPVIAPIVSSTPIAPLDNTQLLELQAKLAAEQAKTQQLEQQQRQAELAMQELAVLKQLALEEQKKQAAAARLAEMKRQQEERLAELKRQQQSPPNETEQLISGCYRDNGDGTVTDVTTNLMWKRCSEGQTWNGNTCAGEAKDMTWDEAMPNGEQKSWPSFAGHDDWRMPTREELRQLVYCSNGTPKEEAWDNYCSGENGRNGTNYQSPTIDQIAFPKTPTEWFWSASPHADNSDYAWVVNFNNGYDLSSYRTLTHRVRLVCAGQ